MRKVKVGYQLDFRNPPTSTISFRELYHQCLAQVHAAEEMGFDSIWLTEHHFTDDGYLPSMMPAAAAIAARTTRVTIGTYVLLAPFVHPLKLAEALQRNQHVAMLVDQYMGNGVEVTFFGRKTKANPMLARLLRQVDCPIHGVRIIRLPGHRFRAELSEEVKPVRDAAGQIDIQGTMQAITSVVEGWIREYPEQWLWLHRRWR